MKWTTKTNYIDMETGEVLPYLEIERKRYIKIKSRQRLNKITKDYGIRYITWECRRDNQTKIFEQ